MAANNVVKDVMNGASLQENREGEDIALQRVIDECIVLQRWMTIIM